MLDKTSASVAAQVPLNGGAVPLPEVKLKGDSES
jgi:hypothetical protein